jgi:serine/threonine protein kinase
MVMKKIGRYIIQGLLGRGGMGKVFKVRLPIINKIAALKILDPDPLVAKLMGMDKLRVLFTQEAVTMAGLNHPNIVAVNDFDEHGDKPFFVMDYYPNNLGTILGEHYSVEESSRRISVDKALDYTLQTLNGLDCLHDSQILHRDIKPFNLLVTSQDTVKICDFGLSKLRHEAFAGPANLNVGSPYYAAPEQEADPDSTDVRTDLYPVGIMLYRMLTCRLPYLNESDLQYPPPSRINLDLDTRWDDFFTSAIARRRRDRFADVGTMKKELIDLQHHWQQHKEMSCARPGLSTDLTPKATQHVISQLRHTPLKLSPHQAVNCFDLDVLWQPNTYTNNRFIFLNEKILNDQTTGLIWQQSGSRYARTWQASHLYIQRLNEDAYGGIKNWRLPTIDELITLLKPSAQGSALCIETEFDPTQKWVWSIDRRSYISAYYVDIELGFVGWQDFSASYYVRAVSSPDVN